jgi:hypothetical protein
LAARAATEAETRSLFPFNTTGFVHTFAIDSFSPREYRFPPNVEDDDGDDNNEVDDEDEEEEEEEEEENAWSPQVCAGSERMIPPAPVWLRALTLSPLP